MNEHDLCCVWNKSDPLITGLCYKKVNISDNKGNCFGHSAGTLMRALFWNSQDSMESWKNFHSPGSINYPQKLSY